MTRQFPLDLRWPSHQRLDAFFPGNNEAALREIEALAIDPGRAWVFLHGIAGTGKSHLLIGACRAAIESGRSARYLSLAQVPEPRADAIAGIDAAGLVAIDDLHVVAGDHDAERALFDLFNRVKDTSAQMLFAGAGPPSELGIGLADLVSRLASCTQRALHPLDDTGRRGMLRLLAGRMGLRLDDEVLDWWFARQPRDPVSLVALLRRIDRAALAAQRRVTIPFLRELLAARDS
ncbi:MAG TPA: DnaA regulatory inactivator Hda [Rhodanobacteraceae bacterium]|jgi:DnaA family protein|nr:DnaA regulatory inactivator Hda [Rhodanobacteraceae bacterium]